MFERLLMDDPGGSVVSTRSVPAQPKDASLAGESEVLRYLYMCFERLKNEDSDAMKQVCILSILSHQLLVGPSLCPDKPNV